MSQEQSTGAAQGSATDGTVVAGTQQGQQTSVNVQGITTEGNGGTPTFDTWEEYLTSVPENIRLMYESDVQGLKNALDAERDQRKKLDKQLRDAIASAEEGSQLKASMEELQANLQQAESRAQFAEEAGQHGVTNIQLAWLAANQIEAFDSRGNVKWKKLKESYPELFKVATPAGNAGAGTSGQQTAQMDMNQLIRQAAGKS